MKNTNNIKVGIIGMSNIYEYYQILGISKQASIDELKRAYRQKAKNLHPDKNKSATAHQDFILLNEAYEYIINYKTGKISATQSHTYNTDWVNVERERAKAKAHEYARMKHKEFMNSPHYKSLTSLATVIDSLYIIFGVGLFIFFPIVLSFKYGIKGFITVLLFFIGTFPLIKYLLKNHISSHNFSNFYHSLLYLIQTKVFLIATTTLINILVILNIGLQTLISANLFFSSFALIILLSNRVLKNVLKNSTPFKLYFYSCCLVPLAINVLLILNFVFSKNPVKETYYYTKTKDRNKESTYIYLDLDKYDEYPGIRLFFSYDAVRFNNTITYTFNDGLLGLRVMTDYNFTNEYRYGEQ